MHDPPIQKQFRFEVDLMCQIISLQFYIWLHNYLTVVRLR